MADYSMLDLFRQEVETQAANLRQSLLILKQQPSLTSELDTALRSLHTIAGAAQLVEIDAAARLAQDLQAGLMAVQNQEVELTEVAIARWLQATDLLVEISQADKNLERWVGDGSVDLAATQAAIGSLIADSAAPENGNLSRQLDDSTQLETIERQVPASSQENYVEQAQPNARSEITAISPEDSKETFSPPAIAIGDSSMLELFRLEVEAQATVLSNGLIAIEAQPRSAPELEALMRAAHSIKGAARIVGLDAAVEVAHVMEDCFVAAQNQTITLAADSIDALLRGVDFLQSLSQLSDRDLVDWLEKNALAIAQICATISALVHPPETPTIPPLAAPLVTAGISPTALLQSASSTQSAIADWAPAMPSPDSTMQDRVVRVSAENLNRMMGLAGESLIGANWLPAFSDALMLLRSRQLELAKSLEALQQQMFDNSTFQEGTLFDTARQKERECRDLLSNRLTELEGFVQRSTNLSDRLYREVIATHMRPFEDGVQGFARMVRDIARKLNKQVKLEILGKSTEVDRDILIKLEAPLTHILRNAVDHGIESPEERQALGKSPEGTIRLEAFHRGGMLSVTIADDGKGIDAETLRQQAINRKLAPIEIASKLTDAELMEFLFLPGFSLSDRVTELSGRGVGLDIAKIMAQEVGGTVRVTSTLGKGTNFQFQLPLTLSVIRTLLVDIAGEAYAFPLARIDQILTLQLSDIASIENRPYFTLDDKNIGLISAAQVLELPTAPLPDAPLWVIVLSDASNTYGLLVDRCLGERELVVRPLDPRLGKVPDVSAAALMGDGSLVLIVDVSDLVRSTNSLLLGSNSLFNVGATPTKSDSQPSNNGSERDRNLKRILVVDDSIAVREMERKLLQNRGYRVEVAVDGMEGWNAVRAQPYDLVISDIDMPRMNGIELIGQIKNHPRLKSIPVIVVSYRDREEDRLLGLDAGADYYLTKSSFHDDTLVEAVMDLIGE